MRETHRLRLLQQFFFKRMTDTKTHTKSSILRRNVIDNVNFKIQMDDVDVFRGCVSKLNCLTFIQCWAKWLLYRCSPLKSICTGILIRISVLYMAWPAAHWLQIHCDGFDSRQEGDCT